MRQERQETLVHRQAQLAGISMSLVKAKAPPTLVGGEGIHGHQSENND